MQEQTNGRGREKEKRKQHTTADSEQKHYTLKAHTTANYSK